MWYRSEGFRCCETCGTALKVSDAANDVEIEAAWNHLRERVDKKISKHVTAWKQVEKHCPELMKFLEKHTRSDRYTFEVFKCNESSCKVCKVIRMPLELYTELVVNRPRMIPLPQENPNDSKHYLNYCDVIYINTGPEYRPSFFRGMTVHEQSSHKAAAKLLDNAVKKKEGQSMSLFHQHHARAYVPCYECSKRRVIFAFGLGDELPSMHDRLQVLDSVLSEPDYEYHCGGSLFGDDDNYIVDNCNFPHWEKLNIFHVKRSLTCKEGIEGAYYSISNADAVCGSCGNNHGLLGADDLKEVAMKYCKNGCVPKLRPFCSECKEHGSKPVFFGATKKTGIAGARKRGTAFMPVINNSICANTDRSMTPSASLKLGMQDLQYGHGGRQVLGTEKHQVVKRGVAKIGRKYMKSSVQNEVITMEEKSFAPLCLPQAATTAEDGSHERELSCQAHGNRALVGTNQTTLQIFFSRSEC